MLAKCLPYYFIDALIFSFDLTWIYILFSEIQLLNERLPLEIFVCWSNTDFSSFFHFINGFKMFEAAFKTFHFCTVSGGQAIRFLHDLVLQPTSVCFCLMPNTSCSTHITLVPVSSLRWLPQFKIWFYIWIIIIFFTWTAVFSLHCISEDEISFCLLWQFDGSVRFKNILS